MKLHQIIRWWSICYLTTFQMCEICVFFFLVCYSFCCLFLEWFSSSSRNGIPYLMSMAIPFAIFPSVFGLVLVFIFFFWFGFSIAYDTVCIFCKRNSNNLHLLKLLCKVWWTRCVFFYFKFALIYSMCSTINWFLLHCLFVCLPCRLLLL